MPWPQLYNIRKACCISKFSFDCQSQGVIAVVERIQLMSLVLLPAGFPQGIDESPPNSVNQGFGYPHQLHKGVWRGGLEAAARHTSYPGAHTRCGCRSGQAFQYSRLLDRHYNIWHGVWFSHRRQRCGTCSLLISGYSSTVALKIVEKVEVVCHSVF